MTLSLETKMDMLKAAIQEDRTEIRLIKDRIYSICTFVTVSSFAVTSFLLDPAKQLASRCSMQFLVLLDVSFLLLLWVLFIWLQIDLQRCHKCLEAREDMIREIEDTETKTFDPYPLVDMTTPPRITEKGLYWIAGVASFVLAMKLVLLWTRL